jgi:hypothetical protein
MDGWRVRYRGALDGEGLEREFIPTEGHIAAALLGGHHERLAARGCWEHASMIGKEKTRI